MLSLLVDADHKWKVTSGNVLIHFLAKTEVSIFSCELNLMTVL